MTPPTATKCKLCTKTGLIEFCIWYFVLAEQIATIRKLDIAGVERLLSAELEKEHFGRLHFGAPEIRRVFSVSFTLQNLKDSRSEHDAVGELVKLIRRILAPTNWRLMSDGIHPQLGVLTGRLRGYDKEYELAELVKQSKTET